MSITAEICECTELHGRDGEVCDRRAEVIAHHPNEPEEYFSLCRLCVECMEFVIDDEIIMEE